MGFKTIDINVDVGEGIGNESELMPYISSCNIACGGHVGDLETMCNVVKLAKENRVKIGAHPSFPDKENFGRLPIKMSNASLFKTIKSQINTLEQVLSETHAVLHHIKPHGALYNLAATDKNTAQLMVDIMKTLDTTVKLYVPFNSVMAKIALQNNIPIVYEAFADRNYNADLSLVSRKEKHALIEDENILFEHVYNMILKQKVITISGIEMAIEAETFCVHGDNKNAVNLIKNLKLKLEQNGIGIR